MQDAGTDPDVEDNTVNAPGQLTSSAGDASSKKNLRDQLRRTLSQRPAPLASPRSRAPSHVPKVVAPEELVSPPCDSAYAPRQYFVLTDAGKQVFTSRGPETSADPDVNPDTTTNIVGIIQALISVFLDDDNDKLRAINAGKTRITFLLRPPLYYACVSSWGEPESVTRSHMEYLHLQILSIVTGAQLRRMFERRTNVDLGRLLAGADSFLTSLITRMEFDLAMATSSLHCLKLEPGLRKRAADILIPPKGTKDILYILLVARDRVVSLVRPKKHSVHPADVHIILNTLHSPSIYNSPASSLWIPMCLPKFNSGSFVNACISFLDRSGDTPSSSSGQSSQSQPEETGIALVCVSGGQQTFDTIRHWCDSVVEKLSNEGVLDHLNHAISGHRRGTTTPPSKNPTRPHSSNSTSTFASASSSLQSPSSRLKPPTSMNRVSSGIGSHPGWVPSPAFAGGTTDYSVSNLGIPGLRHFVYKARPLVQITHPVYDDVYGEEDERRRLITLYQLLHDNIHAKSGQGEGLKLQYFKTDKEAVMGWITQAFELYIAVSPLLPKSAAVNAANAVARWVKKEEARLFLRDAPVF